MYYFAAIGNSEAILDIYRVFYNGSILTIKCHDWEYRMP